MAHTETELKLSLAAHDVPRLLAHPLLAAPPRTEHLLNTYFDTPDLALKALRMAVRERLVGERTLLTVKTAGHSVNGLTQRSEWEGPTTPGALDFAALVDDAALATRLTGMAPTLRPVFRTDFTRRSWVLTHAGARIEVALDDGAITTGHTEQTPQGTRSEALLELELELLDGPPAALTALSQALEQGAAREAGERWLHPSDRSKAQRGLALFLQGNRTPSA
jgi:inorganic triphosphatase YgiF